MVRPAMVKPYIDAFMRIWWLAVRPTRGRTALALRTAIISMVAVLIGEIWQLPMVSLLTLTLAALWQGNRVANMKVSVLFVVFFTIVTAALYIGLKTTINNFLATLIFNLCLSFIFFFLSTTSILGMISVIGGLVLSYMLVSLDNMQVGDSIMRMVLSAWRVFLTVAGLLAFVGSWLAPSPEHTLVDQIVERLNLAAKCLARRGSGQPIPQAWQDAVMDTVGEGVSGMFGALGLAGMEHRWNADDLSALRRAALNSFGILQLVEQCLKPSGRISEEDCTYLAGRLEEMAECFVSDRRPTSIEETHVCSGAISQEMERLLCDFAQPMTAEEAQLPSSKPAAPAKKPGFFLPGAFTDKEHIRYAVKGTVSVCLAIITYKMLNWQGVHTCIITCFIVSLPTMGAVLDKQRLRICGALIGCSMAMGIITWIMPHMTNIAQLLLAVGIVIFFGAWVKAGDQRISYMGLQIIVAFSLSDLAKFVPATDLTVPRDRIIGILIGLGISFVVHTVFWPRSAMTGALQKLKALDGLLAEDVTGWNHDQRMLQAAKVQEAASGAMSQLRQAMIEPAYMRPTQHRMRQYILFLRRAAMNASCLFGTVAASHQKKVIRLGHILKGEETASLKEGGSL